MNIKTQDEKRFHLLTHYESKCKRKTKNKPKQCVFNATFEAEKSRSQLHTNNTPVYFQIFPPLIFFSFLIGSCGSGLLVELAWSCSDDKNGNGICCTICVKLASIIIVIIIILIYNIYIYIYIYMEICARSTFFVFCRL